MNLIFFTSALSKFTWTQRVIEIHPPRICFSPVLNLFFQSSLVFEMICRLPEEDARGSLALWSPPAKHIWKWFQGPPHLASITPGFPAAWSRGGRNLSRSKVDASKVGGRVWWGRKTFGNVILALRLSSPLGFPMGS